jgi:hypothetical protein
MPYWYCDKNSASSQECLIVRPDPFPSVAVATQAVVRGQISSAVYLVGKHPNIRSKTLLLLACGLLALMLLFVVLAPMPAPHN